MSVPFSAIAPPPASSSPPAAAADSASVPAASRDGSPQAWLADVQSLLAQLSGVLSKPPSLINNSGSNIGTPSADSSGLVHHDANCTCAPCHLSRFAQQLHARGQALQLTHLLPSPTSVHLPPSVPYNADAAHLEPKSEVANAAANVSVVHAAQPPGLESAAISGESALVPSTFPPVHSPSCSGLHLALMYANPLVMRDRIQNVIPIESLAQHREQRLLMDSLEEAKTNIRFRVHPATMDKLRILLSSGCTALHFSGHGIAMGSGEEEMQHDTALMASDAASATTGGDNSAPISKTASRDLLVFECADGSAHFVDATTLSKILQAGSSNRQHRLKLVFVASCHSLRVGLAFLRAGVDYVVCVKREEKLLDRASIVFSRAFYHALFSGLHSVEDAFNIGQVRVASEANIPTNESDKFVLLTPRTHAALAHRHSISNNSLIAAQHQQNEQLLLINKADPACTPFYADLGSGTYEDLTPRPLFPASFLPAAPPRVIGRNVDMHHIISLLLGQRLVTCRGPPGIGKTTVVKSIAHYVVSRSLFRDGVLYVSLRGIDQSNSTYRTIARAIKLCRDANSANGGDKTNVDLDALNVTDETYNRYVLATMKDKSALMVWDNAEDPLNANPQAFGSVVTDILDECPNITILLGTRTAIGGGHAVNVTEKVYTLASLGPVDSAKLFEQWAPRPIALNEFLPPSPPCMPAQNAGNKSIPNQSRVDTNAALIALSQHPVLKFLSGHPHAISLCAPLLQDRSMSELEQLLSVKSLDALQMPGRIISDGKVSEKDDVTAVNTLIASLDASIENLRRQSIHCVDLFCLMGALPGGALADDLQGIWGSSPDAGWKDLIHILIRSSLIVRNKLQLHDTSIDRYSTFPFVTKYAERMLVSHNHKNTNMTVPISNNSNLCTSLLQRCRYHYSNVAQKIYSEMGSARTDSVMAYELLDIHELNIWQVLKLSSSHAYAAHATKIGAQKNDLISPHTIPNSALTISKSNHSVPESTSESVPDASNEMPLHNAALKRTVSNESVASVTSNTNAPGADLDNIEVDVLADADHARVDLSSLPSRPVSPFSTASNGSVETEFGLDTFIPLHSSHPLQIHRIVSLPSPSSPSPALQTHGHTTISSYGRLCTLFASILFLAGRPDASLRAAEMGLPFLQSIGDILGEANLRKLLAVLYSSSASSHSAGLNKAKRHLATALTQFQAVGCLLGQGITWNMLGHVHCKMQNMHAANNCYTKALGFFEEMDDLRGQLNCYKWLAPINKKLPGHQNGALEHYKSAKRLQAELKRRLTSTGDEHTRWSGEDVHLHMQQVFVPVRQSSLVRKDFHRSRSSTASAQANSIAAKSGAGKTTTTALMRSKTMVTRKEKGESVVMNMEEKKAAALALRRATMARRSVRTSLHSSFPVVPKTKLPLSHNIYSALENDEITPSNLMLAQKAIRSRKANTKSENEDKLLGAAPNPAMATTAASRNRSKSRTRLDNVEQSGNDASETPTTRPPSQQSRSHSNIMRTKTAKPKLQLNLKKSVKPTNAEEKELTVPEYNDASNNAGAEKQSRVRMATASTAAKQTIRRRAHKKDGAKESEADSDGREGETENDVQTGVTVAKSKDRGTSTTRNKVEAKRRMSKTLPSNKSIKASARIKNEDGERIPKPSTLPAHAGTVANDDPVAQAENMPALIAVENKSPLANTVEEIIAATAAQVHKARFNAGAVVPGRTSAHASPYPSPIKSRSSPATPTRTSPSVSRTNSCHTNTLNTSNSGRKSKTSSPANSIKTTPHGTAPSTPIMNPQTSNVPHTHVPRPAMTRKKLDMTPSAMHNVDNNEHKNHAMDSTERGSITADATHVDHNSLEGNSAHDSGDESMLSTEIIPTFDLGADDADKRDTSNVPATEAWPATE